MRNLARKKAEDSTAKSVWGSSVGVKGTNLYIAPEDEAEINVFVYSVHSDIIGFPFLVPSWPPHGKFPLSDLDTAQNAYIDHLWLMDYHHILVRNKNSLPVLDWKKIFFLLSLFCEHDWLSEHKILQRKQHVPWQKEFSLMFMEAA